MFFPDRGSSHSPGPGPCALSLPLVQSLVGRHLEAQVELFLGFGVGEQPGSRWKENLLGVGTVLGAAGHTEMPHGLGLIPQEGNMA